MISKPLALADSGHIDVAWGNERELQQLTGMVACMLSQENHMMPV